MAMTFGIHIGHMGGPLDEMRKLWKFADANGFDWFSVSDHLQESPPRGGDLDCYEAISTLTAAAVETRRVHLGALVYCVGNGREVLEPSRRNTPVGVTRTRRQSIPSTTCSSRPDERPAPHPRWDAATTSRGRRSAGRAA